MAVRRGSSLIELLAVVSVMASLMALLLPAVQSSREAARAAACRNNLRQVGIAISHFESAHRHFPKGAEGRYDRRLSPTVMYGVSWWADTLPYLEGEAIADRLDRQGNNTGWIYWNSHNGEVVDGFGPAYWFCPSSKLDRFSKTGDYQIAAPSYSGISGATSHDEFPESRVNRCCRSEGEISAGGVLVPNAIISSQQITDGLSNTVIVGEQSDFSYTAQGQPFQISAGSGKGWLAGSASLGVPPNYEDWMAPSHNLVTLRYPLNERRYELPGIYVSGGANNPLVSPHPNAVNLLYCDGSVHAVSDSMEVHVLKSLATRDESSGASL